MSNDWAKNIFFILSGLSVSLFSYVYYVKSERAEDLLKLKSNQHEYDIIQLGEFRRDQYLFDKKTGKIWSKVCYGENEGIECDGISVWEENLVIGINITEEQFSKLLETHERLKSLKKERKK